MSQNPLFGQQTDVESTYQPPTMAVQQEEYIDDATLQFADSTAQSFVPAVPQEQETAQLAFQETNIPSYGVTGQIRSNDQPAAGEQSSGGGGNDSNQGQPNSKLIGFISLEPFQKYFDVDTTDVLQRITSAFTLMCSNQFYEQTREKPDLYGPFWIASTLVFVTAVSSNLYSYVRNHNENHEAKLDWDYDPKLVVKSMGLFYGYTFIAGLVVWLFCTFGDVRASLVHLWCIYGYALVIFIPVSVICAFCPPMAVWITVMAATGTSLVFLILNLKNPIIENFHGSLSGFFLMGAIIAHVALGLLLKVFLFTYRVKKEKSE